MASTSAGPIRLFVLGDARIETPKGEIEPTAEIVFAAALYLILERKQPVARRTLERLLWPGVKPAVASHRLRQTLLKLRRSGIPVEPLGKSRLQLSDANVTVDYEAILIQSLDLLHSAPSASLVLLSAYDPHFSDSFLEWLDAKRREIGASITRVMLGLIARHRNLGQWADVEMSARALRDLAPFNEEAVLALAEAHAMRGSKLEGIRILDSYLSEIGRGPNDLRIQATLMRKRIANRTAPTEHMASVETPLVGRASTLGEMGDQLTAARERRGQSCLILGEAGIGKSRLLAEFAGFAALQGFSVQRIQCRASHKHRPLSAFVELVPSLRGLRGAIGCSPDTLRDLDRLTQHRPMEETSNLEDTDAQWVYGRVLHALFDIMDAVAEETPLLIQIEDVHWLDAISSEVLADMIKWGTDRTVFFAMTGREAPEAWSQNLPNSMKALTLRPLDDESSTEVVLGIARRFGHEIDKSYLEWCVRVAEGNPYFLQELATHWVETGVYYEVPPSLSAVLGSRVARLDRDALQVLQTCSLLENNSSLNRLEQVLGYEPHRLLHSINSLGSAGMMVVEAEDADGVTRGRVASKHELLSNVALQRLTAPARLFLHRRIGLVLEQEVDEQFSTSILWDCAKHWQLAGDSQRALSLALSCARHLMKVGLSKAASDAYERCISFCISDRQRLEVLEGEAVAHYRVSDWQRVRDITALARAVKERVSPNETHHDDLELMDLRAEWQSLQWSEIAMKALQCLEAAEASPRHRVEGGIMAMMLLGFQGNGSAVANTYRKVEDLIQEHDLGAALACQSQMVYHTGFGDLSVGVDAARQLVVEQRARANVAELFRAYCNSAVTFRVAGLFEDAENSLRMALELAERYNLDPSVVRVLPMLANMALERGRTDEAKRWHSKLAAMTIHPSNRFGQLELGGIGARLALLEGDGNEALRLWPMTRAEAKSDGIYHRRTYNCALQIGIDLALNGVPDQETLECLVAAYHHSKIGMHQAFGVCVIYAALVQQGETDRAEALFQDYVVNHRREPWPVPTHLIESALSLGHKTSRRAKGRQKRVSVDHSQR